MSTGSVSQGYKQECLRHLKVIKQIPKSSGLLLHTEFTVKPSESHREPFISKSMLEFEEKRTLSEPVFEEFGRITDL